MTAIIDAFEEVLPDLKIDQRFVERIRKYQLYLLTRDKEHLAFFGSNLLGVHSIRFRVADAVKFYNDVLDIEASAVEKAVKGITTIVHEHKTASDPLNLTIMYLIHKCLTEARLADTYRKRGAYELALIFFYRCVLIKQSEWFTVPADPKIAQAAYGELSKKNLIKQLGTWKAVMEYRANDLIDKKGIHYKTLIAFNDDLAITYAVSDSEGRIRDMYKNYCKVFYAAHESGNKIMVAGTTVVDMDGEVKIKEKVKSVEQHISLLRQLVMDRDSFIKQEVVKIILDINTNSSLRMLTNTLEWIVKGYGDPKYSKELDEWMAKIIVHSFYMLSNASMSETRDYTSMLVTLKNLYLSTRSTDKDLVEIRKAGDRFIKLANGSSSSSLAMATRTAVILYITFRSIVAA